MTTSSGKTIHTQVVLTGDFSVRFADPGAPPGSRRAGPLGKAYHEFDATRHRHPDTLR